MIEWLKLILFGDDATQARLNEYEDCIKSYSVYEVEKWRKQALVLHLVKTKIASKPPKRRTIGLKEIEEIENDVFRK